VVAVENPQSGWVILPVTEQPQPVLQNLTANNTAHALASSELPIWQVVAEVNEITNLSSGNNLGYTWYIGGTLPEWKGAPLAIAILLEENNPHLVQEFGYSMFQKAIYP
jgi:hypothetical protein